MAQAWNKIKSAAKSALGLGDDSSQTQIDETSVDDSSQTQIDETSVDGQPCTLEESKVSVDLKKPLREGLLGNIYTGKFMGKECAVKVFNSGVFQAEAVQRQHIASIIHSHPNIVLVHGLWYGNPAVSLRNSDAALVMELCNMSLDAYLKEKVDKGEVAVFRLDKRLDILSDVISGMIYLHSSGIVHGHLSAKKVLLNFDGASTDRKIHAKVVGVCEMKLFTPDALLKHRDSVKKSGIMPPEVMNDGEDAELTEAVDLFSFGCLIAHVASCVCPTSSNEDGLTEFEKHTKFITHHQNVFKPLIERCLSEQPEQRGTFEDVQKYLSVHQPRYGGKQAKNLDDEMMHSFDAMVTSSAEEGYVGNWVLSSNSVVIPDHSKKVSKLGEGAFSKVFKGEYSGKPCAVKVFKEDIMKKVLPRPGQADKLNLLLPTVKHQNIVQMYGVWYNHKAKVEASIVMELCDESLHDAISKLSLKNKQKLLYLRDISSGMLCLHSHNIFHGNLHSGNVLLCQSGSKTVAKLADFDMARCFDPAPLRCLPSKHPDDMFFPPEMRDRKEPNEKRSLIPKVDIFCFGELALEMACGSYPTPDKQKGHKQTQTEVQRRGKYLAKLGQSDKGNLDLIIRKCLSDSPEGRPSFTSILSDIEGHLQKYGEWPDVTKQKKTVESEAFGAQALRGADSKSAGDMQAKIEGHQHHFEVTGQLPLALEASQVTFDSREEVGRGSFATVYKGMYKKKECAVKVFNSGAVRNLIDIQGESQLDCIIQCHPNVVLVHGLWYGNAENMLPGNHPALVMELCNTNLEKYLQEKLNRGEDLSFETATKSEILRDIAAGMIYLHSEQIVHGCLTAHNVLLNVSVSEVVAKVTGFGQSRLLVSHIAVTHGKSNVMKPQVKDSQDQVELDKAEDVFSFGRLIPYVASCRYPEPRSGSPGNTSELDKCSMYIRKEEHHVFHPVMQRCLEETPQSRGTFEEIIVPLKRYSKRKLDERKIERQRSQLLQFEEVLAAERKTCLEAQRMRSIVELANKTLEEDAISVKEQLQLKEQRLTALERDLKKLKEELNEKCSAMERLHEQYQHNMMKCNDYCQQNSHLQKEIDRLSGQLNTSEREKVGIMKQWTSVEEQKHKADKQVSELQTELVKMKAGFAKERQQFQRDIATKDVTIKTQQDMLQDAQKREEDLKDQERCYCDDLEAAKGARDKIEGEKRTLVDEKAALKRQVRQLNFTVELRDRDMENKEKRTYTLMKDLEAAQKAAEDGTSLERILREKIEVLEEENKDLMTNLKKSVNKQCKTEEELTAALHAQKTHEDERNQKNKAIRAQKGECDRLTNSMRTLQSKLSEKTAECEGLKRQRDEEAENYRLIENEKEAALESTKKLQKQLMLLNKDHVKLRRKQTLDLQNKVEVRQEMMKLKLQMKAESDSALLERVALEKEKGRLEGCLKAMSQDLKAKQEELNISESFELGLRQRVDDVQDEYERLKSSREEVMHTLNELRARCEEVESQRDEEAENCQLLKGQCDRMETSTKEMKRELCELIACKEALTRKYDEESEKCRLLQNECDSQASWIQEQKARLDEEVIRNEEIKRQLDEKTENCCHIEAELAATAVERDNASLELIELIQSKRSIEECMEAMSKDVKSKQEELNLFASAEVGLSQRIEDLQGEYARIEFIRQELLHKLKVLTAHCEEVERQRGEEAEKCRLIANERDRFAFGKQELEQALSQMTAHAEELDNQLHEQTETCQHLEKEIGSAVEKAEQLQKQLNELYRDGEKLRKVYTLDLQRKMDLIEELEERELQIGKQFKATKLSLKEKEKEWFALETAQLNLLQHSEELEKERQQFVVQLTQLKQELVQVEAKLANATEERDALRGQLGDYVVTKEENKSLRDEIRHCNDKAKALTELEKCLTKKQIELATERKMFAELKKKFGREFVTKENLESTVRRSVRESFTERGEELLNASGMELSESGGSEGSPDSAFLGRTMSSRDMALLAQHSQQKIDATEEGKREVEEALRQKEREMQYIQHQLDRAKLEVEHQKRHMQDAERKVQDYFEEIHKLARTYFESHRYPPFLYQLHQLQKHLPSSSVQGISTLGDGRRVEVTRVTDLRSFTPYESWCDEFQSLIDELKAMPSKQCQAYMLISFLHCGEVITFYRFHVALVPQVLSCERDLHPNELEGDAMPKAMLVYAHTELKSNNLKEFGITPHRKGVLLQPQCEGYVPELTRSQLLRKLKDTPAGLKHTEECLDANILHQLQRQYKEFAKPRTAHRVSPMGVAMALI